MQNNIPQQQQGPPQQQRQQQGPPQQQRQQQQQVPQKQQQRVPPPQKQQKGVPPPQKQESNGNEFDFKKFFENYTYEIICAVAVVLAIFYTLYTNDFDINKIFKSDK